MDDSSAELLARCADGDEDAAAEIFERYIERLTLLARSRMSPRMATRSDPEDVVQSAYRSFFVAARRGRFAVQRSGDLWRLLTSITLHKLYRNVQHHKADKRSIDAEMESVTDPAADAIPFAREPAPDEAVALADELESFMSQLTSFGRRVLELRLQGEQMVEIARETRRSERTVRRQLSEIRRQFSARITGEAE